jgi:hypothetical protein
MVYAQLSFFESICSKKHPIFKALILFKWPDDGLIKKQHDMVALIYLLRPDEDILENYNGAMTDNDRDEVIKEYLSVIRDEWLEILGDEFRQGDPKQMVLKILNYGNENGHNMDYISLTDQTSLSNLFIGFANPGTFFDFVKL